MSALNGTFTAAKTTFSFEQHPKHEDPFTCVSLREENENGQTSGVKIFFRDENGREAAAELLLTLRREGATYEREDDDDNVNYLLSLHNVCKTESRETEYFTEVKLERPVFLTNEPTEMMRLRRRMDYTPTVVALSFTLHR